MAAVTTLIIAADHPALPGHFPGAPIVPGVLLLDEALRAAASAQRAADYWRIGSAKFIKPVRPGRDPDARASGAAERLDRLQRAQRRAARGARRARAGSRAGGVMTARPAQAAAAPRTDAGQWAGAPERGSATLLVMMIFVALHLGRPLARVILYVIAALLLRVRTDRAPPLARLPAPRARAGTDRRATASATCSPSPRPSSTACTWCAGVTRC